MLLWLATGAAVFFTIGLCSRIAYTTLVAAILLTRLAMLQSHGIHDWVAPTVILLGMLIVPWGDGFSLDQRLKPPPRRIPADRTLASYGAAIWVPSVVMGLAFAAAAFSKLWESGLGWVWSGAVKYHFVEDAAAAPVPWGLWIAAHDPAAVAVSAGAIVSEAGLIVFALSRRPGARLVAAVLGLSLFAGFYLFQGVLWWPWAMWLLAFMPWDGWRVLRSEPASILQWAVLSTLVAAQVFASISRVEIEPVLSPYPMYAGTYSSPEEYERHRRRKYQRVQIEAGGQLVDIDGDDGDRVLAATDSLKAGRPLAVEESSVIERLCRATDKVGDVLTVHTERTTLDWTKPLVERQVTTGTARIPCQRAGLP